MARKSFVCFAFLAFSTLVQPKFLKRPEDVAGKTYDFIVVGGGAGGNIVASRLSENPDFKVLLIEAGPSDLDYPDITVPQFAALLWPNQSINYNYTLVPTESLNNRIIELPRGRVLGGSASISFLLQTHGSREFWDQLAIGVEEPSLSFDSMAHYFKKFETWVPPMDGHDLSKQYNPIYHGTDGPIQVTVSNHNYDVQNRIHDAAGDPDGFPLNLDVDNGNMLGLGWAQLNQGGGVRSSSTAYIHGGQSDRPNFDILLETTVTRLLFAPGSSEGNPVVAGVEVTPGPNAPLHQIFTSKEVILSGGAIGTPIILMLSGLGDAKELTALGIKTVKDIPDVGKNLQDHPALIGYWEVNTPFGGSLDDQFRNSDTMTAKVQEWQSSKTGPLGNAACTTWIWDRLPDDDPIFDHFADPTPGGSSPNTEVIFCDGLIGLPLPAESHFVTVEHTVISPVSRGYVRLKSTDPFGTPVIDPKFMDNDFDMYAMRRALKRTRKFLETTPSLANFTIGRYGTQVPYDDTDAGTDAFIRDFAGTLWHPSSTCPMAKSDSRDGVIDPQHRVKGVDGLRIVDLSIFPNNTAGHPTGMLYAVAERASDLIKNTYAIDESPREGQVTLKNWYFF